MGLLIHGNSVKVKKIVSKQMNRKTYIKAQVGDMAQLPHHRLLLHYCSAPRRFCGGDAVTQ
jgi:hypothetical protein